LLLASPHCLRNHPATAKKLAVTGPWTNSYWLGLRSAVCSQTHTVISISRPFADALRPQTRRATLDLGLRERLAKQRITIDGRRIRRPTAGLIEPQHLCPIDPTWTRSEPFLQETWLRKISIEFLRDFGHIFTVDAGGVRHQSALSTSLISLWSTGWEL
jgi:hypothetical protein